MKRLIRLFENDPKFVVQDWIGHLSMMQQTVMLEMIRGCDGTRKDDPTKSIIREIRKVLLKDAGGEGSSFMVPIESWESTLKLFFEDCDAYPLHFVMHLLHAIEIIGYKHPDSKVSQFWRDCYFDFCHTIHVNPESEEQMDNRLYDGRDEAKHGSEYKLITEWKAHGEKTYTQTEVDKILVDSQKKAESETRTREHQAYWSGRDAS